MTLSGIPQVCCRVLAVLTLASSLSAGVIFQRPLPTINLNNAAGVNRSNVEWAPGNNTYILGDDFTLASNSVIDTLSVWEVSNNPSSASPTVTNPNVEFASLSLYAGADIGGPTYGVGTPLSLISSSYTPSLVSGYQYQDTSGVYYDVYKISFSGLNLSVLGGAAWDFGVASTSAATGTANRLFLHASNAGLSGPATQDGADGYFLSYTVGSPYSLTNIIDPTFADPTAVPPVLPLWDKGSDINVEIQGTEIPEPATFGMLTISAGALLFLWRRRRA